MCIQDITDKEEMTPEPAVFKAPTSRPPKVLHGGAEVPRPEQPSVAQLFQDLSLSEREELLFIQLPDTIPGRPNIAAASEKPVKKDSKAEDKRSAHGKTHVSKVRSCTPYFVFMMSLPSLLLWWSCVLSDEQPH